MMLVSSIAFSQTGTGTITTDSIVPLPKNVAKEVVKEIIRKDSIQAELTICYDNQKLLENNLVLKDSIIHSKDSQIDLQKQKEVNYETMLQLKDAQITNLNTLVDKLNKDIKKNKRKSFFKKIGNTVVIGGLAYLVFTLTK